MKKPSEISREPNLERILLQSIYANSIACASNDESVVINFGLKAPDLASYDNEELEDKTIELVRIFISPSVAKELADSINQTLSVTNPEPKTRKNRVKKEQNPNVT
jgi:hypothetical protein